MPAAALLGSRCVCQRRAANAAATSSTPPPPSPPAAAPVLRRRAALAAVPLAALAAVAAPRGAHAGSLSDVLSAALVQNAARSAADSRVPEAGAGVDGAQRDVKESADGLLWVDLREGEGAAPRTGDLVVATVRGFLPDGSVFEDTELLGSPLVFTAGVQPRGVCDGLEKGLLGMRAGGKRLLTVPAALGFGASGTVGSLRRVPANSSLRYELELLRCGPGGEDGLACCTQPAFDANGGRCDAPASFLPAEAAAQESPLGLGRTPTVDEMTGLE